METSNIAKKKFFSSSYICIVAGHKPYLPFFALCACSDSAASLVSQSQLDHLPMQPQENGASPGACVEQQQQQHHLLQKLLDSESKYRLASEELQVLRTQQTKEMEEVKPQISVELLVFLFVCSPYLWSWMVATHCTRSMHANVRNSWLHKSKFEACSTWKMRRKLF